jgi:1,2-diacylglycerol 3-beta-glucosyltransferase
MSDIGGLDLLNTVAFLLCVGFCAYVLSILALYLRAVPSRHGNPNRFQWHVIVPCLNEAAVITGTVQRLLADFPDLTVWCVNDGSDDGTGDELAALALDRRVRVVTRVAPAARQGKGAALNAGWQALHDELATAGPWQALDTPRVMVGVIDADSRLDPHCLDVLAGPEYFGRDQVSAVQIEVRMANRGGTWHRGRFTSRWGRLLVLLQDLEFRGPISAIQQLRRRTGSVGLGGNGQFARLSILDIVAARHGTPWHGALLEDFELGLHILLVGGRTDHCAQTWVAQEGLTDTRGLLRQRTRWAQGSMQCLKYGRSVLRSQYLGSPAALEIAYFLSAPWTQLLGSAVYLGCAGLMLAYAFSAPDGVTGWWSAGGWGTIPLVVMFGVAPFSVWGLVYRARCHPAMSRTAAIGLGLGHWIYSYLQCVAVWLALFRLVRAKADWQKTSRLTDAVGPPRTQQRRQAPAEVTRSFG